VSIKKEKGYKLDLTKGMECPCCGIKKPFQGGSFGGGTNTTNFVCDCGFTAWIIITQDDMEYSVKAEFKDRMKANPYKDKSKDELILERYYTVEALENSKNFEITRACQKALEFIDDILNKEK